MRRCQLMVYDYLCADQIRFWPQVFDLFLLDFSWIAVKQ